MLKLRCDTNRPGGVHWYKGNDRVLNNARIHIRPGIMEVTDVTYEDSGLYVCVLRGSGETLRNFTITVTGKASTGHSYRDVAVCDRHVTMDVCGYKCF